MSLAQGDQVFASSLGSEPVRTRTPRPLDPSELMRRAPSFSIGGAIGLPVRLAASSTGVTSEPDGRGWSRARRTLYSPEMSPFAPSLSTFQVSPPSLLRALRLGCSVRSREPAAK